MLNHDDRLRIAADARWRDLLRGYSLAEGIDLLSTGRKVGRAAEVSAELEREAPCTTTNSIMVPWELFATRALTANAGGPAGAYLVETDVAPAADALRPSTVLGALGATIIAAPTGSSVTLPRQTGTATGYWLGTESTQIPETDQAIGQVNLSPKTVGTYTEISGLLLRQAPQAEAVVRRDLASVVGRAIDKAAMYGTGINGQPTGIVNTPNIQTFSGTTLALSGMIDAAVALGDGLEVGGVAANRTTAGTLAKRQVLGGSQALWTGSIVAGQCAGFDARSSTALGAGNLILAEWRHVNIVAFGPGIEIVVNPFDPANFTKRVVGVRCMASVDVGVTYPSAINYAAAVT